jgi:hypothetical protein
MNMTTIMTMPTLKPKRNPRPSIAVDTVDLTRGARNFGIRSGAVFLDPEVLCDYAELDTALGHNVAGLVLCELGCHMLTKPRGSVSKDLITVCLCRREDDHVVEVDFHINRVFRQGNESLYLRKAGERILDFDPAT